jgi:aminoglycoside phosphotransferase (APT) family kinase protein
VSAPPEQAAVRAALEEAGEAVGPELEVRPLAGGASRDLWLISCAERLWVLRRDPVGETPQTSRESEFRVQSAAYAAGVPVPRPITFGDFGTPGMIMEHVAGESIPRRVLRGGHAGVVRQLGEALAALRGADLAPLVELSPPPSDPSTAAIAAVRGQLEGSEEALPALELGLRWLGVNRLDAAATGVVHGDMRLGNFIVDEHGLKAIIDWEFWHLGDPVEDLAWLCARPWRFGNDDKPAAGLGSIGELLEGFAEEIDPARLLWWEVISQVKWGAYCARQAALRRDGAHESLERTVLARRVAEAEWDMLELIGA